MNEDELKKITNEDELRKIANELIAGLSDDMLRELIRVTLAMNPPAGTMQILFAEYGHRAYVRDSMEAGQ